MLRLGITVYTPGGKITALQDRDTLIINIPSVGHPGFWSGQQCPMRRQHGPWRLELLPGSPCLPLPSFTSLSVSIERTGGGGLPSLVRASTRALTSLSEPTQSPQGERRDSVALLRRNHHRPARVSSAASEKVEAEELVGRSRCVEPSS